MTPQEFQTYLNHQRLEIEAINRIADVLEQIALAMQPMLPAKAPDVVFDLASWASFDWSDINATIVERDASGPTVVSWRGQLYFRRSPSNKFAPAIWFSRCIGKDEKGENTYERLCTFKSLKHLEVEPLPDKVRGRVSTP